MKSIHTPIQYPYVKQEITSFITEYLIATNQKQAIEQYSLQPFTLNVLDKRRTIVEKLVSLIRFSFSENITKALAGKIRHFYDLYYLANGWQTKTIKDSPLRENFPAIWENIRSTYQNETTFPAELVSNPIVPSGFSAL